MLSGGFETRSSERSMVSAERQKWVSSSADTAAFPAFPNPWPHFQKKPLIYVAVMFLFSAWSSACICPVKHSKLVAPAEWFVFSLLKAEVSPPVNPGLCFGIWPGVCKIYFSRTTKLLWRSGSCLQSPVLIALFSHSGLKFIFPIKWISSSGLLTAEKKYTETEGGKGSQGPYVLQHVSCINMSWVF